MFFPSLGDSTLCWTLAKSWLASSPRINFNGLPERFPFSTSRHKCVRVPSREVEADALLPSGELLARKTKGVGTHSLWVWKAQGEPPNTPKGENLCYHISDKGVMYFRSVICFRLGHTCPCIATPTQTGIEEWAQTLKLRVQILHLSLNTRPYTNHFVSQNLNFFISKLGLIILPEGQAVKMKYIWSPIHTRPSPSGTYVC